MKELTHYRESNPTTDLSFLRKQNEQLKATVDELRGSVLYPYAHQIGGGCRKCNTFSLSSAIDPDTKKEIAVMKGPDIVYEEAYSPSWLGRLLGRKAHPERIRRTCKTCRAVYYEKPADRTVREHPQPPASK